MASLENVSHGKITRSKKRAASDIIFDVVVYTVLVIFAIVVLYPVMNIVAYSFSDGLDAIRGRIHIFPRMWSLASYKAILFEREGIRRAAVATISRTLIGTVSGLFANALLAYIISRRKFLFKSALSLFWVITIYAQAGLIPTLCLYRRMQLTDSFWVYIIPGIISGMYVLVMRTYMKSIPHSLEEAAQLEGAGHMQVFWSVISPLCKPVYAAIALFIATAHWNSWFDALLYNRMKPEYSMLQFEIMKILNYVTANTTQLGDMHRPIPSPYSYITLRSVLAVLSMLPLFIIYPFLQKHFVSGVTIRGIKD